MQLRPRLKFVPYVTLSAELARRLLLPIRSVKRTEIFRAHASWRVFLHGDQMTPAQIVAVQSTFALVVPNKEKMAELFYERLFSIDQSIRHLFKGDMAEQGKKLMLALALVVAGLADLSRVLPAVKNLARRHSNYGVEDHHYDSVGSALLWSLRQVLGDEFTPEVCEAWTGAYTTLASVMKDAAQENRAVV
jgi:nitric oxide dioxygenase